VCVYIYIYIHTHTHTQHSTQGHNVVYTMETADVSDESTVSVFRVQDWRWRQKSLRNFSSSTRLHGIPSQKKHSAVQCHLRFLILQVAAIVYGKLKRRRDGLKEEELSCHYRESNSRFFLAAQPINWLELSQFINTFNHMVRTSVCKAIIINVKFRDNLTFYPVQCGLL